MQFQITSNIDDGDDNHMDFSNDESFDDDVRYESWNRGRFLPHDAPIPNDFHLRCIA